MIEDAIDPRPATGPFEQLLGAHALALEVLQRDPAALARNWNDRESVWGNLRDFRHWLDRAHDLQAGPRTEGKQTVTFQRRAVSAADDKCPDF